MLVGWNPLTANARLFSHSECKHIQPECKLIQPLLHASCATQAVRRRKARPTASRQEHKLVKIREQKTFSHKTLSGHPGLPGRVPGQKDYVPWVPKTAHKPLTLDTRPADSPPPDGHRPKRIMFMCHFLSRKMELLTYFLSNRTSHTEETNTQILHRCF